MRVTFQGTEMYIHTRCEHLDEVVALFAPFVDDTNMFVPTLSRTPPGMETAFRILLVNAAIVVRGRCVVRKVCSPSDAPFRAPGLLLAVRRLTPDSQPAFDRMRALKRPLPSASSPPGTVAAQVDDDSAITRPFQIRFRPTASERKNPIAAVSEAAIAEFVDHSLAPLPGPSFPNPRRRS